MIENDAEQYISKILNRRIPYTVEILSYKFIINTPNCYPPGKLTAMFAKYLIDHNFISKKVVADIGCGCMALGIIAQLNGAKKVIGSDINSYALQCAEDNIKLNNLINNPINYPIRLFKDNGIDNLLLNYKRRIDVLLSGAPWDSISKTDYNKIKQKRQCLSRAFYDIDDKLITDILTKGFELLTATGKILITSSKNTIERIDNLCNKFKVKRKILFAKDIHLDGNLHYILELKKI